MRPGVAVNRRPPDASWVAALSGAPYFQRPAIPMTVHAPDPSHLVVLTTLPDHEAALRFVRTLVDARIVACGTALGDTWSVYRWQGAIEENAEVQVLLKTRRERWDDLVEAVRAAHPYDVPELIAVPVEVGLAAYLRWVDDETKAEPGD